MQIKFGNKTLRCQLAKTPEQHALGLAKHARLRDDEGMLFVFPRPKTATFFMSTVSFPIDIIGLDADSRVSKIVEGAMPGSTERWTFPKAGAVLEVPGGLCRKAGVRKGALIEAVDAADVSKSAQLAHVGPSDTPGSDIANAYGDAMSAVDAGPSDAPGSDIADAYGPAMGAVEDLAIGDTFKVGRFGPTWVVVQASGAYGFVQQERHKRKWFGYSHNRDTGEIAVYPVKQGSGDRIGDPVAYGPIHKSASAVSQRSVLAVSTSTSLMDYEDAHEPVEDHPAHTTTVPGGHEFDVPKEEYFKNLWGPDLENAAMEVGEFEESAPITRAGEKTAQTLQDRVVFAIRDVQHYAEKLKSDPNALLGESEMARLRQAVNMLHHELENGSDSVADEDALSLAKWVNKTTNARKRLQDRGMRVVSKRAQIVDEAKFVEKVSDVLFGKFEQLQWTPDALNGGNTERCVINREILAQMLNGAGATSSQPKQGAAAPESTSYILDAASSERGLSLIGDSFVLAGAADFGRVGYSSKRPQLVLYRES